MNDHETHSLDDDSAVETTNKHIFRRLHSILADDGVPVDWNAIHCLLKRLVISNTTCEESYSSPQDDPTGRLLITKILSRCPPIGIVDTATDIFPHSLHQNPPAFLAASKLSSADILKLMFRKMSQHEEESCPYPWILLGQVSTETCQNILEMFPEGVMQSSAFLSSLNLLDYFLVGPEIVGRRKFDITLWTKFKLVLLAAGCMISKGCTCSGREIAPVHLILNRVLSRPDFWTSPAIVEHILWLLHQLRWTDPWIFEKKSSHGRYPIHVVLSYRCTQDHPALASARVLTQLLLEACPHSASVRFNDKLPLHMAVENGWPCHDLLLAAHPESLDDRDTTTDLFPFQSAAKFHQRGGSPISLDMTYELLRANPMHLCCLHGEARRRVSEVATHPCSEIS